MNKLSHQNNTVVCYQHLSSYQCKAQHNWKERIFLVTNKNRNNKVIFSVCIRYWMKYIGLPSNQEPWVNCSNLPRKAGLFSLYILPGIASFKGHSAGAGLDSQLFPLLLLVCSSLHLPRLSWGMRDAFHFLETSSCAVVSVVSWGMVMWGFWTAAQGRPRLTTQQPWNSFHYTINIPPEAGQLSI